MKKLTILLCAIMLQACAQDKKKTTKEKNQPIEKNMNTTITAQNFVDQMVNQTIHFNDQPMYYLRINKVNCLYEVLVNDFPVDKMYELGYNAAPTEINQVILKSGIQKVTYRLYPIGNLMAENYEGNHPTIETLINDTEIEIEVIRVDDYRTYNSTYQEKTVLKHTSLKKEKTDHFIATGQKYYEYSFTFDATVPYKNEGWLSGQDLTQFDQKLLNQKIIEYYQAYQEILQKKDANTEARVNFKEELRNSIALYRERKDILEVWNEYMRTFWVEKDFQPLENYKTMFYGEGRIVSLRQSNIEDLRLRGKCALWFLYKEKGIKRANFPGVYLYLPKGEKLEDGLYMMP